MENGEWIAKEKITSPPYIYLPLSTQPSLRTFSLFLLKATFSAALPACTADNRTQWPWHGQLEGKLQTAT